MQPTSFGVTHVPWAAGATILSIWAANASPELRLAGVLGGLAIGTWAGVLDGRRLERSVDSRGGLVLYAEDSVPYAILWPLGVIALTPFAFASAIRVVSRSPDVQLVLEVVLCGLTAAWLAYDIAMVRRFSRIAARQGSLQIQRFYGRSAVGPEGMVGRSGEVAAPCEPSGFVRIGGELWRAESIDGSSLFERQRVTVRRLNGLVLLVEAADGPASNRPLQPTSGARAAN